MLDYKITILFVDDEHLSLNAIRRFFRFDSYKLSFADSGANALEVLAEKKIDILVTDLRMPQMDGFELLEEVNNNYPSVLCLVLSATTDEEEIISIQQNPLVFDLITKPLDPVEFRKTIRNAVDSLLLTKIGPFD